MVLWENLLGEGGRGLYQGDPVSGVTIPTNTGTGVKEYGIMGESPGGGGRGLYQGDPVSGVTIPTDTGRGMKEYGTIVEYPRRGERSLPR